MAQFTRPESQLVSRHRALGSNLEDWNGTGAAWSYSSDPYDEHDAYRETATLTDMVGLKKIWVRGPDAFAVVDNTCSRTLSNIGPEQCALKPVPEGYSSNRETTSCV
jgi:aminomethyltransferase